MRADDSIYPSTTGHYLAETSNSENRTWVPDSEGLTVRDHIAIEAISGKADRPRVDADVLAKNAYKLADAMIAESEK